MNQMAIRMADDILENASLVIEEEKDIELVRPSVFAHSKLLEGLLKTDPENEKLAALTIKALFFLSFAFLEEEYEKLQYKSPRKAVQFKTRASTVYQRAFRYGGAIIMKECEGAEGTLENVQTIAFVECIKKLEKDYSELAFWTGFAWAKYIFLNADKPIALMQLPKLLRMMERVEELDETYYFGSLYVFFGIYYGSRSRLLGGNPEKSIEYFNKAVDLTEKKNLMAFLFKAQFYAKQVQDKELFERDLEYVLNFNDTHDSRMNLMNAVSQLKARRLLQQKEELF